MCRSISAKYCPIPIKSVIIYENRMLKFEPYFQPAPPTMKSWICHSNMKYSHGRHQIFCYNNSSGGGGDKSDLQEVMRFSWQESLPETVCLTNICRGKFARNENSGEYILEGWVLPDDSLWLWNHLNRSRGAFWVTLTGLHLLEEFSSLSSFWKANFLSQIFPSGEFYLWLLSSGKFSWSK